MTAAAASDRPSGRLTRLAHYPLPIAVAAFLLDAASRIPHVSYLAGLALGFPALAVFLVYAYAQMQHGKARLCDKCATDAPLDPQAAVAKKMRWLKLTHRLADTRWRVLPWVLIAVLAVVSYIEINGVRLTMVASLFWLALLGPAVLLQIHNPLQPWCPFCRWGRGEGPEEPSPEPTPDPSEAPEKDVSV